MSKEQAMELYNDLHRTMQQMVKNTASMNPKGDSSKKNQSNSIDQTTHFSKPSNTTYWEAESNKLDSKSTWSASSKGIFLTIAALCAIRLMFGIAEFLGVNSSRLQEAKAVTKSDISLQNTPRLPITNTERDLLLDLDRRRVDLESRSARLDDRAKELSEQEKALSVQLSELRELTGALRQARLENSKEESAKVEQLSKVYGSMNPPEAAALIEQLDIQIALPLLVRMPDKRMAQILALMKPERAVMVTRMLSSTKYDSSALLKQSLKPTP